MAGDISVGSDISKDLGLLSQKAVSKLVQIADLPDQNSVQVYLVNLFITTEAGPDKQFFTKHSFEVISKGNTLNIKITNKDTQETKVLGIAKKMSDNQFLPPEVRDKLAQVSLVAPKYSTTKHHTGNYNFVLTDFYPKGSFNNLYERKGLSYPRVRQECASNMQKIAEKMQSLQKEGVFFPDAKVTNWLLDDNNQPVIADEKSLRTFEQARKAGFKAIATDGYWPPGNVKMESSKDFEKIHAYVLGANIYDYLTSSQPPVVIKRDNNNFQAQVFDGNIGKRYKQLILDLTNPEPSIRTGLDEAIKKLKNIQLDIRFEPIYPNGVAGSYNRHLAYNANAEMLKGYDDFKVKYKQWKGDRLKMEILRNLSSEIDEVTTPKELSVLKIKIMGDKAAGIDSSPEFKILKTHQGLISNVFIKTKSHQALETLFDEKEASLRSMTPSNTGK